MKMISKTLRKTNGRQVMVKKKQQLTTMKIEEILNIYLKEVYSMSTMIGKKTRLKIQRLKREKKLKLMKKGQVNKRFGGQNKVKNGAMTNFWS